MRKIITGLSMLCIMGLIATMAWGYEFTPEQTEMIIKSGVTPEREAYLKTKPYEGVTIKIAALAGNLEQSVKMFIPAWEEQTGGKVRVIPIPYAEFFEKFWIDCLTGTGNYDAVLGEAFWMGQLAHNNYIQPIDEFMKDPRFPYWDPAADPPSLKKLRMWEGKQYEIPWDCDGQVLYYRKDVLDNPDYKKGFWEKYGYEMPVPPSTWDELRDIAEFFNGWDWDNDGKVDYGMAMHLKVGGQGMFHFESMSAPYLISPVNPDLWWFDPETMKPLITSPGHVEALKMLVALRECGPRAALSWSLGEAWDCFLRGDAVLCFSWGDLGSLAQDETRSVVKGKLGVSPLPGTLKSYDPVSGKWIIFKRPNIVGNTTGGSWSPVISAFSKHPAATYDFCSFMSTEAAEFWNACSGWTGVDPGRTFTIIEPYGPAKIEDYVATGYDASDAKEYTSAYYKNFYNPVMYPYLRVPGAAEYNVALDVHLSEAVTGTCSPEEALKRTYDEWERITERLGRDEQIKLYQTAIGYSK